MADYNIKLAPPEIDLKEIDALPLQFLNGVKDPGKSLRKFEAMVSKKLNVVHCLALNSGTSALHLALLALNIKPGDEVLCPSFTFAATINAILYTGAIPIIVDSEDETWNISPSLLLEAINDRVAKGKYPKALLLAHTYGMPARIDEIMAICEQYGILVIEDAAGSLGATYEDKYLGTIGKVGIISFNYNKIITTAGGGILMTNDAKIRDQAAYLATQAKSNKPYYEHQHVGYNYQMNGLAAEIGISQFDSLTAKIHKKRRIFDKYVKAFAGYPFITFQQEPINFQSNRWLTTILLESQDQIRLLREKLGSKAIEVRNLWNPMHLQPAFKHFPQYIDGTSESLFKTGLALPSGTGLSDDQHRIVCENIKSFLPELTKS